MRRSRSYSASLSLSGTPNSCTTLAAIRHPHENSVTPPAEAHDDDEADDDWGVHSWSSLPSLPDWDGEFRHQLPRASAHFVVAVAPPPDADAARGPCAAIEELTSPQERQELTRLDIDPLQALRRPSATEDWEDYLRQVANWEAGSSDPHVPRPRYRGRRVEVLTTPANRRHGRIFE